MHVSCLLPLYVNWCRLVVFYDTKLYQVKCWSVEFFFPLLKCCFGQFPLPLPFNMFHKKSILVEKQHFLRAFDHEYLLDKKPYFATIRPQCFPWVVWGLHLLLFVRQAALRRPIRPPLLAPIPRTGDFTRHIVTSFRAADGKALMARLPVRNQPPARSKSINHTFTGLNEWPHARITALQNQQKHNDLHGRSVFFFCLQTLNNTKLESKTLD